jgi:hypothetical protein
MAVILIGILTIKPHIFLKVRFVQAGEQTGARQGKTTRII